MLKLYETVSLQRDIPEEKLKAGDVGMVIEIYDGGYEVEFGDASGNTIAVISLYSADIAPLNARQILHVRNFAEA